ncbi:MAG TPA: 3-dehydroquinate synthase [Actinomycetes bacterium]|nr:3-dehydroquinate synthase [Actinomycetes bacterium]
MSGGGAPRADRGPGGVRTVQVPLPGRDYAVHVGRGLLARVGELAGALPGARAAALVHPPAVAAAAETAAAALAGRGLEVRRLEVPDGEAAKRLQVVASLYERFAAVPLQRADPVVAVGGGATTDTAGFAAATWLRGVPLVAVPTTVLAMVDAAVGGKTGVDLDAGKNLVGAFHQPRAVVADLDTLATLPLAERRSGLAEVVKAGLVADPALAEAAARDAAAALAGDPDTLAPLVEAAVRVKAQVVAADEREADRRAILNYGHTLGHALERLAGYRGLRHGEAVSLGMVFAARVAEATGFAPAGLADGHVRLLRRLGLPVGGVALDPDEVLQAMATDKKRRGGLRLVLLRAPGEPALVPAPDAGVLAAAVGSLGAEPP